MLPASDQGVAGSNPAGGKILPEPKRRFIAQSLSCSSFHRLEVTEILLKGRKTLTHPTMLSEWRIQRMTDMLKTVYPAKTLFCRGYKNIDTQKIAVITLKFEQYGCNLQWLF